MALMPLESSILRIGVDIAIVVLSGTLTLGTNLKIVDQQMQSLIEEGIRKVVLDLSKVAYADSAGLGTIVHTYGLLQERGGTLRLGGISERVAALLKMTKTDTFIPIDPDQETSIAALS
jgi:anti-sigma B factor antagonist